MKREKRPKIDTEALLRKTREEQIHGIEREKVDGTLFSIDLTGNGTIAKQQRRKLGVDDILACKSIIAPVNNRLARTNIGTGIVHKKKKGPLPPSELRKLKKIARRLDHKVPTAQITETKASYDVWTEPEQNKQYNEWVEAPKPINPPSTLATNPVNLNTDSNLTPAVQIAEAGQSYNPVLNDWTDLVARKANEEEQRLRKKAAQAPVIRPNDRIDERFDLALVNSDDKDASDDEAEPAEETEKKVKQNKRKTTAERNKEKRKIQQAQQLAKTKAAKKSRLDLVNLGTLIQQHDALTATQKSTLLTAVKVSGLRKHKFGKYHIPIDPLEIQLTDELADSLRTLRPEGNVFKDRFMSLVKRGIVEARVPQVKRRRYALVTKERYSHKYGV